MFKKKINKGNVKADFESLEDKNESPQKQKENFVPQKKIKTNLTEFSVIGIFSIFFVIK